VNLDKAARTGALCRLRCLPAQRVRANRWRNCAGRIQTGPSRHPLRHTRILAHRRRHRFVVSLRTNSTAHCTYSHHASVSRPHSPPIHRHCAGPAPYWPETTSTIIIPIFFYS